MEGFIYIRYKVQTSTCARNHHLDLGPKKPCTALQNKALFYLLYQELPFYCILLALKQSRPGSAGYLESRFNLHMYYTLLAGFHQPDHWDQIWEQKVLSCPVLSCTNTSDVDVDELAALIDPCF